MDVLESQNFLYARQKSPELVFKTEKPTTETFTELQSESNDNHEGIQKLCCTAK